MASDPIRNAMAANRDIPKKQPSPFQDCSDVVHIALFFDGTGNNKDKDGATQSWSNVARIFHAAQSHVQLNTYPIYIAGVGTPFNGGAVKWNSMPGVWIEDKVLGMGSGGGGERRLSLGDDSLNDRLRAVLIANARARSGPEAAYAKAGENSSFAEVNEVLGRHRLIKVINMSLFGFSRGAALARAFSNRIIASCEMRGGELIYQGYTLRFNFMGLFDTVASFGLPAKNVRMPFTQRDLVVSPLVERCVHYVAAHEVRGAFPVDLIRKNGGLGGDWIETTYPGVHSDVGGGYEPNAQGIDNDYARIPMREMMREASASGVRILSYKELERTRGNLFQKQLYCRLVTDTAYASYMGVLGNVGGTIEDQITAHQKLFYRICGTMHRKGIETPGDRRRDESKFKYLGAKGMAFEISAYRFAAANGKWIRFGEFVADGFARYMKPEQWQIDAWDTSAPDGAVHFGATYVHDSMVDFLGNMVDSSYFKARGVVESGDSVWQEGGRWFSRKTESISTTTNAAVRSGMTGISKAADAVATAARDTADTAHRTLVHLTHEVGEVGRIHERGMSWVQRKNDEVVK